MAREYLVTWQIELEAESPEAAAAMAEEWMRDYGTSWAYSVRDRRTGKVVDIDRAQEN